MSRPPAATSEWLTLGQASQLLGVHPTTLRAWADAGLVHAFLTPGGHRRFQTSELDAFVQKRQPSLPAASLGAEEQTLEKVRGQLEATELLEQPWYQSLSEDQRAHHRRTGQRLLQLLTHFVGRPANSNELLAQARGLALEYGREFAARGLTIGDLAQGFLLFRHMIVSAAYGPASRIKTDGEGILLLQRIDLFMDEFLLATLGAFEQSQAETASDNALVRDHKNSSSNKKRH